MKSELERAFDGDMHGIYVRAKKECGYNAKRLLRLITSEGGLAAAKQLIATEDGTYGFTALWENHRLDLSVEAHVLKPEYESLFTEEERRICRDRLEAYGYNDGAMAGMKRGRQKGAEDAHNCNAVCSGG